MIADRSEAEGEAKPEDVERRREITQKRVGEELYHIELVNEEHYEVVRRFDGGRITLTKEDTLLDANDFVKEKKEEYKRKKANEPKVHAMAKGC